MGGGRGGTTRLTDDESKLDQDPRLHLMHQSQHVTGQKRYPRGVLDPDLELAEYLDLMLRDELGVGDEEAGEEGGGASDRGAFAV